ncbi:Golgin candidate 4-like protein [Gossypium australe]|uniref:Golgin candidate 4-like protein n=1 Tax=Gossypium australe TaxID=47621 RepID=A0A5B6W0H3_9ROSI|nr:Golgin candidate 4-like protein [Gossypium australe]
MWTSIANLKENLNKITLDVHGDDDEELEIYGSENGRHSTFSDRRNSHTFAPSKPVSFSPLASGIDSPFNSEIGRYRAEIKKLQESEAEIKALSVNYAALLKEKEEQIFRLNQENGSLKQNLNATNAGPSAARSEISKVSNNGINALKGKGDQSANRQHKSTSLVKNCYAGNQMSNGLSFKHDGKEKYRTFSSYKFRSLQICWKKKLSLEAIQASHESQIKQFKMELEKEHDKLVNVQIRLQEEHKRNESFQEELKLLKSDKDKHLGVLLSNIFNLFNWQRSAELSKIRNESNKKTIEINCLQKELNRREDESSDDTMENMKRLVATLEKETLILMLILARLNLFPFQ